MPSKGKRQNPSGTSASRAVKRRRQENPEPQSESESGPEVGTRPPPSSEVRIRETIDLKKGSFVKRQRFVNGELVEETVEELDSDEAKAALKVQFRQICACSHRISLVVTTSDLEGNS
jgi:hypothetical protein